METGAQRHATIQVSQWADLRGEERGLEPEDSLGGSDRPFYLGATKRTALKAPPNGQQTRSRYAAAIGDLPSRPRTVNATRGPRE
ncbi:hypothetical protein NDU88_004804 [Pleurodeles waltl]|uniref:Uncharacterized protein n=1 Tax=Pleurodeles waltl TaxID=8319 RepID=A0AAV7MW73_PLEWA|nr:hypothetical protein NDU88_004804 [Pleurodeles waltl]